MNFNNSIPGARMAALLVLAGGLSGCSLKLMALRQTAALMEDGVGTFYDESDTALAQDALGSQLKMAEAFLRSDPADPRLNLIASQGYGAYAFLFLEGLQDDRAREFYRRGRDYGFKLLDGSKAFKGIRSMDLAGVEAGLKTASKKDVPALFWTAYSWAGWVNLSRDNMEAVADLPKAVAIMMRVRELDPGYQFGGPDLFLGAYYASRPRMLGGDPAKSKAHFSAARSLNRGKYLLGLWLEARYYAVAVQDESLFAELIEKVRSGEAGSLAGSRLADEVAKRKAAALLEKKDELF
ncbi:MAG: hypothetical protein HZB91_12150 [Elusimicrobia bacterium]|nr:hypothetical protein [Elusimicrobiota bacterium]